MFVRQAGADYPSEVLADGPLLYLRFEDSNMTHNAPVADLGSVGRGGTYIARGTSSMHPTAGAPGTGQAAYMPQTSTGSGAGNCIDVWFGDLIFWPPVITYEVWAHRNPGDGEDYARIFQQNGDWLQEGGPGIIAGPGTDDGQWHHLVVTYDSTGSDVLEELYVDGVSVGTAMGIGELTYPYGRLTIGAEGNMWWMYNHFKGGVDEFAIYEGILSADRVAVHYGTGITEMGDLPVYGVIGGDTTNYFVIPEPATALLLSLGGLALIRKRRV
jgi:hypothetical protein